MQPSEYKYGSKTIRECILDQQLLDSTWNYQRYLSAGKATCINVSASYDFSLKAAKYAYVWSIAYYQKTSCLYKVYLGDHRRASSTKDL
jgi:hypothetical protein